MFQFFINIFFIFDSPKCLAAIMKCKSALMRNFLQSFEFAQKRIWRSCACSVGVKYC